MASHCSHNIWVKLDRYPPLLVRLLAKTDTGVLMSDEEIVALAGGTLRLADVIRLSHETSWDTVPVAHMKAFVQACRVDFGDPSRMRHCNRYIRTAGFKHLLARRDSSELVARLRLLVP